MSSTSQPHLPAPTRRAMLKGAAWGAPAVVVATAAPAAAASVLPDQPTDLAIDVVDPPVDMDTWQPEMTVPVYQQDLRTVAQMASLPPMVRVTNVGSVPAMNPVGTFEAAMKDYASDYIPLGSNQVKLASGTPQATLTEIPTPVFAKGEGSKWNWSWSGTLQPSDVAEIPLKYWVRSPFANVTFELLVVAFVQDEQEGDWDDNSERLGQVPGFTA